MEEIKIIYHKGVMIYKRSILKFLFFFLLFWQVLLPETLSASSDRYLALSDSADYYIGQENWQRAESFIIEALRLEPANFSNSLLFSNLGVIRTNQGKFPEALDAFNLGLNIAPSSTILLNNRARTYIFTGEKEKALDDIIKSLSIDSLQPRQLMIKGNLLIEMGKYDEAKIDFENLIQNFRGEVGGYAGLGRLAEKKGDFDSAIDFYEKELTINENQDILSAVILLLIDSENYRKAMQEINKGLEKFPENPDFHIWKGHLLQKSFLRDEALEERNKALSKGADPELIDYYIPVNGR